MFQQILQVWWRGIEHSAEQPYKLLSSKDPGREGWDIQGWNLALSVKDNSWYLIIMSDTALSSLHVNSFNHNQRKQLALEATVTVVIHVSPSDWPISRDACVLSQANNPTILHKGKGNSSNSVYVWIHICLCKCVCTHTPAHLYVYL